MKKEKEHQKVERTIELLNTEMKVKYPPGSSITFSGSCKQGEKNVMMSCSSYNKVGGERKRKNIVSKPPEWQNIPYEEAKKICAMFDKHMLLTLVYVPSPWVKPAL